MMSPLSKEKHSLLSEQDPEQDLCPSKLCCGKEHLNLVTELVKHRFWEKAEEPCHFLYKTSD